MKRWAGFFVGLLSSLDLLAVETNHWSPHCRIVLENLGAGIIENDPIDIHEVVKPKPGIVDAVAVVVMRNGKFLLNLRKAKPMAGMLGYLGGKLSPGESIFEAAQRELQEEGKFLLKSAKLVRVSYAFLEETGLYYRVFVIEALVYEGEPVNAEPEKSHWIDWLSPDELKFPLTTATWEDLICRGFGEIDKGGATPLFD